MNKSGSLKKKKLYGPFFYGWDSTASTLEPLREGSSANPNKYKIQAIISNNPNNSNNINNKDTNGESTISVNFLDKQKHGKATTTDNPKHGSKANVNNSEVTLMIVLTCIVEDL